MAKLIQIAIIIACFIITMIVCKRLLSTDAYVVQQLPAFVSIIAAVLIKDLDKYVARSRVKFKVVKKYRSKKEVILHCLVRNNYDHNLNIKVSDIIGYGKTIKTILEYATDMEKPSKEYHVLKRFHIIIGKETKFFSIKYTSTNNFSPNLMLFGFPLYNYSVTLDVDGKEIQYNKWDIDILKRTISHAS